MVGRAIVFVFGLPSLIAVILFTKKGYQGDCVAHLGISYCGQALYIYSAIFGVILLLTLFLAYLWRD